MASDETLGSETLDAIEARHELELVEVKKVTAGMTGKKDAMQVLHIEGEVTDRHYLEMRRWEELHETTDGSDDDPVIRDEHVSDASPPRGEPTRHSLNPKPVNSAVPKRRYYDESHETPFEERNGGTNGRARSARD